MSFYREKSRYNSEAANLCLKNNLYAPSVHCSYYSCVQYMFHVLFEKLKMTRKEFNKKRSSYKGRSHMMAIDLVETDLRFKKKNDADEFQDMMRQLKKLREKSDYGNCIINQKEGWKALHFSKGIKNILNKNYK